MPKLSREKRVTRAVLGSAMVAIGGIMATPIDELVTTLGTGGAGAAVAIPQLFLTSAGGSAIALYGANLLADAVTGEPNYIAREIGLK